MSSCELILSGFADEAAIDKTLDQQFAAFAALGLEYLTIRFVNLGSGTKNIVQLDDAELEQVIARLHAYGLRISSLGSPIGKVKLMNVDDGTGNQYYEFREYIDTHVVRACSIARRLNTKLIRGFSFYHPKGMDPNSYISDAADRISEICSVCESHGLTFGLEVEANLVGHNAATLMAIYEQVNRDTLVLVFDGANLVTQGYTRDQILQQFKRMSPALGWIHIKDYKLADAVSMESGYVDEEALDRFVPAGRGDSGYPEILKELAQTHDQIDKRQRERGLPGIFADLEPHLKGGGQFGGFSGPDGFGVALREFCRLCDIAGISYRLRDSDSVCSAKNP